jgi:hypothetical protein
MGIYLEGGEHDLVGQGAHQTVDFITHDDYEGEPASEWVGSLSTHLYHNMTGTRNASHDHTIRSCDVYKTGIRSFFLEAIDPLAASLSADSETITQFGHRVDSLLMEMDKTGSFVQGFGLIPRHDNTSLVSNHAV